MKNAKSKTTWHVDLPEEFDEISAADQQSGVPPLSRIRSDSALFDGDPLSGDGKSGCKSERSYSWTYKAHVPNTYNENVPNTEIDDVNHQIPQSYMDELQRRAWFTKELIRDSQLTAYYGEEPQTDNADKRKSLDLSQSDEAFLFRKQDPEKVQTTAL